MSMMETLFPNPESTNLRAVRISSDIRDLVRSDNFPMTANVRRVWFVYIQPQALLSWVICFCQDLVRKKLCSERTYISKRAGPISESVCNFMRAAVNYVQMFLELVGKMRQSGVYIIFAKCLAAWMANTWGIEKVKWLFRGFLFYMTG